MRRPIHQLSVAVFLTAALLTLTANFALSQHVDDPDPHGPALEPPELIGLPAPNPATPPRFAEFLLVLADVSATSLVAWALARKMLI